VKTRGADSDMISSSGGEHINVYAHFHDQRGELHARCLRENAHDGGPISSASPKAVRSGPIRAPARKPSRRTTTAPFFHRVIAESHLSPGRAIRWSRGTGGPGYKFADESIQAATQQARDPVDANSGPNTNGGQFFTHSCPRHGSITSTASSAKLRRGWYRREDRSDATQQPGDRPLKRLRFRR